MNLRSFWREIRDWRLPTLAVIILTLTFVHQVGLIQGSPYHQILDILPYLPIILGALWFGLPGGVTCAVLTSICYLTHLLIHEGGGLFGENIHRTLNIAMFSVVGIVTGYLSQRQSDALARYRHVAAELEESYEELQRKTEELFRSEEHLQRANRLSVLGELTAGLAHEIGNPLAGIKGAAEILADGKAEDSKKDAFARLLLEEVDRLESVVCRFLDCVRPRDVEKSEADVFEALQAVVSVAQPSLEQRSIQLDLEVEDGLPRARSDPHELQQVFLNLLLNAIQATPEGGRITLHARRAGDGIECRVEDTGCGIAVEDLPRLFDPFFTRRVGGTGLGLAITHKILEGCRGRVSVESRPGHGSVFTVTLPSTREADVPEQSAHR